MIRVARRKQGRQMEFHENERWQDPRRRCMRRQGGGVVIDIVGFVSETRCYANAREFAHVDKQASSTVT